MLASAARVTLPSSSVGATLAEKTPASAAPSRERLGVSFGLLLVWLWLEYGRPEDPLKIPFIISAVLLVGWIVNKDKRWSRQSSLLAAFLAVMAVGVPLAANSYSAFWSLYSMATILVCICLPLPSLVTSVRKVRVWIYTFVAVALYVGLWALFHGGYGPSGAGGAQDENYVAAMMGMAVSLAYFSIFAAKTRLGKVVLAGSILVFLAGTVAGRDVSRGGFLGHCAVFLYCLVRSPRKWVGVVLIALIAALVVPFVGSDYWDEIRSIGDVNVGTSDLRLEIWQIGLRMWRAHPIFGVGAGNFRWMVGAYQSPAQLEKYGRDLGGSIIAHSLFVELLAELGIAGALVLLFLLVRTFKDLRQVVWGGRPRAGGTSGDALALRCYADAVTGAIIACVVNGAFLSLLYYSYLWLFVMLGSAIWQLSRTRVHARQAA
jgi:O-antigen ligase